MDSLLRKSDIATLRKLIQEELDKKQNNLSQPLELVSYVTGITGNSPAGQVVELGDSITMIKGKYLIIRQIQVGQPTPVETSGEYIVSMWNRPGGAAALKLNHYLIPNMRNMLYTFVSKLSLTSDGEYVFQPAFENPTSYDLFVDANYTILKYAN